MRFALIAEVSSEMLLYFPEYSFTVCTPSVSVTMTGTPVEKSLLSVRTLYVPPSNDETVTKVSEYVLPSTV